MSAPPSFLKAGMIGLDTSHAPAFIRTLNQDSSDPTHLAKYGGVRVVAAYPQGSREILSSLERVPKYTAEAVAHGVKIVDSIEAMLQDVDVVFLESNDGRVHWEQILPVLEARKPVFVDKPVAHQYATVRRIYAEATKRGVPIFSSSVLRFGNLTQQAKAQVHTPFSRVVAHSPAKQEPSHPDLFWYGIHGCEVLFTLLGKEIRSVRRLQDEDGLIHVIGTWANGATGEYFESNEKKRKNFGGQAYVKEQKFKVGDLHGYNPLLEQIVRFFKTGIAPVDPEETLALYAFMEAADASAQEGGREIDLQAWMKLREAESQL